MWCNQSSHRISGLIKTKSKKGKISDNFIKNKMPKMNFEPKRKKKRMHFWKIFGTIIKQSSLMHDVMTLTKFQFTNSKLVQTNMLVQTTFWVLSGEVKPAMHCSVAHNWMLY